MVQKSPPIVDHCQFTISLPFTYKKTTESTRVPKSHRQVSVEPILEDIIETNDGVTQTTTSPSNNNDDVAQIQTELNLTVIKRESPKQFSPILYSKVIMTNSVKFHKFQPISCLNTITSLKKDLKNPIPVMY